MPDRGEALVTDSIAPRCDRRRGCAQHGWDGV